MQGNASIVNYDGRMICLDEATCIGREICFGGATSVGRAICFGGLTCVGRANCCENVVSGARRAYDARMISLAANCAAMLC